MRIGVTSGHKYGRRDHGRQPCPAATKRPTSEDVSQGIQEAFAPHDELAVQPSTFDAVMIGTSISPTLHPSAKPSAVAAIA